MFSFNQIPHILRRAKANEDGAIVVEFALMAPVFLILLIGVIDMGRMLWAQNSLQYAVEESARYAMVNQGASMADLESYATTRSNIGSGVTFTASSSTSGTMNYRTITAQYAFTFMIPLIPIGEITLSAKSSTPVNET